jgi:hypothetical protein
VFAVFAEQRFRRARRVVVFAARRGHVFVGLVASSWFDSIVLTSSLRPYLRRGRRVVVFAVFAEQRLRRARRVVVFAKRRGSRLRRGCRVVVFAASSCSPRVLVTFFVGRRARRVVVYSVLPTLSLRRLPASWSSGRRVCRASWPRLRRACRVVVFAAAWSPVSSSSSRRRVFRRARVVPAWPNCVVLVVSLCSILRRTGCICSSWFIRVHSASA